MEVADPEPLNVTLLVISRRVPIEYVPEHKYTVSPLLAASSADWIVAFDAPTYPGEAHELPSPTAPFVATYRMLATEAPTCAELMVTKPAVTNATSVIDAREKAEKERRDFTW
jgi:hypothetical protein